MTVAERAAELAEKKLADIQVADARPPEFSDEALALRFAERHADDLRYVAAWGRWLRWDGARWASDDTLYAFDIARAVCRVAAASAEKPHIKTALASAKTVAATVRLAKADRRLAATVGQWDRDIWLLNTPDGVVDLRTGDVRAHRPDDYATLITAVGPGGDCPTWLTFLAEVTDGDAELQGFLQRLAGYVLSGSIREHCLAFLYGTGANGKSVFVNALAGVLGGYHKSAPIETFTASHTDHHPTDLAMLRGARLVTAVETEAGRRWAESRIKMLTGGDRIAARFMRQDFFEFTPTFKLLVTGNNKPGLRSVDEAIRRRFHLIPFVVTIPPAKRDLDLGDRLRREWPGILAWAIRGCLTWQRDGLMPPVVVRDATATYLEGQDAIGAWIDDACARDYDAWESQAALFASWKAWATRAGEFVMSRARFLDLLETRGFARHRQGGTGSRGILGLRVVKHDADDAWRGRP